MEFFHYAKEETDTKIETVGYSDNLVCSSMIITLLLLKGYPPTVSQWKA